MIYTPVVLRLFCEWGRPGSSTAKFVANPAEISAKHLKKIR
jgi:hypothetical protein